MTDQLMAPERCGRAVPRKDNRGYRECRRMVKPRAGATSWKDGRPYTLIYRCPGCQAEWTRAVKYQDLEVSQQPNRTTEDDPQTEQVVE